MTRLSLLLLLACGVLVSAFVSGQSSSPMIASPSIDNLQRSRRNYRRDSSFRDREQHQSFLGRPRRGTGMGNVLFASSNSNNKRRKRLPSTMRKYDLNLQDPNDIRPGRPLSMTSRLNVLNMIMYGLQVVVGASVTNWGIKLSNRIVRGEQLYRLVTPVFLHGGLMHLMTNTYSLNAVGPSVEMYVGPGRFLATYLFSGIMGNLLSAYKTPNPALGASGAVFGILGSYVTFLGMNVDFFGPSADRMMNGVIQSIGLNLMYGVFGRGIDNWGHIGGALGGVAFTFLFGPRIKLLQINENRVLVDVPLLRMPRYIESIPSKIGNQWNKLTRRLGGGGRSNYFPKGGRNFYLEPSGRSLRPVF